MDDPWPHFIPMAGFEESRDAQGWGLRLATSATDKVLHLLAERGASRLEQREKRHTSERKSK